jgi:hypothetical protein
MLGGVERRVFRLEKRVAKKSEKPSPCNCRVVTRFHDATCLDAILEGMSGACPLHGIRELGFFLWSPAQYPLYQEDNELCPCPPHPWRSFLLNPRPHTWEQQKAASDAWSNLPPRIDFDLNQNNRQTEAVLAEYFRAREQSVATAR